MHELHDECIHGARVANTVHACMNSMTIACIGARVASTVHACMNTIHSEPAKQAKSRAVQEANSRRSKGPQSDRVSECILSAQKRGPTQCYFAGHIKSLMSKRNQAQISIEKTDAELLRTQPRFQHDFAAQILTTKMCADSMRLRHPIWQRFSCTDFDRKN